MKYLSIIFAAMLLASCASEPLSTDKTGNPEISVQLLFEHDGCKVYRFYDGSRRVYYTNCQGSTSWRETRSSGKSSYSKYQSVSTSLTDSSSNSNQ